MSEEALPHHPTHSVRENVEGYYCGRCGKMLDEGTCEPVVHLDDYDILLVVVAAEAGIEMQDKWNPAQVKFSIEKMRKWAKQSRQRERLRIG